MRQMEGECGNQAVSTLAREVSPAMLLAHAADPATALVLYSSDQALGTPDANVDAARVSPMELLQRTRDRGAYFPNMLNSPTYRRARPAGWC